MGYLDLYAGTHRVDLGDGYWVDLKRYLTQDDVDAATTALLRNQRWETDAVVGRKSKADVDTAAWNRVKILRSIVAWNLTDENDQPLPRTEQTIGRLPGIVTSRLLDEIAKLNEEEERPAAEQARFPERGAKRRNDGRETADRTESTATA